MLLPAGSPPWTILTHIGRRANRQVYTMPESSIEWQATELDGIDLAVFVRNTLHELPPPVVDNLPPVKKPL